MKLVVLSHKQCWPSAESPTGYATDGGFPLQMAAIAELFDATDILVPCSDRKTDQNGLPLDGHQMNVTPLTHLRGRGIVSKIAFPFWLARNMFRIVPAVWRADAIHAPIPGNVGTVGILLALLMRKPLFVRHCGNWRAPRTVAERAWKRLMETFAGGRNVMLATGGDGDPPSLKNPKVHWIFSTSLTAKELEDAAPRSNPPQGAAPQLIIACRQVKEKGTERVIEALPELLAEYSDIRLEIVGAGLYLDELEALVRKKNLERHVTFRRHVPQPQVLEALRSADLFCYPTSASEGFPKVVLEAMATGLPVITTRVSVLSELLSGGAGILLDDDKPSSIAAAVKKCLAEGKRYVEMSVAAVKTAQTFSLERWADSIGTELRSSWGTLRSDE